MHFEVILYRDIFSNYRKFLALKPSALAEGVVMKEPTRGEEGYPPLTTALRGLCVVR